MSVQETFVVGGRRYSIESSQPRLFEVYYTAIRVGHADSIEAARKLLFDYAVSQTNAEYHGHQERMVSAQKTLSRLGTDPFNLRVFRE